MRKFILAAPLLLMFGAAYADDSGQAQDKTLAQNMGLLETAWGSPGMSRDMVNKRFTYLLTSLAGETHMSQEDIGDRLVITHEELKKQGIEEDLLKLTTEMNILMPQSKSQLEQTLAMFIVLRGQGDFEDDIVRGLKELLSTFSSD